MSSMHSKYEYSEQDLKDIVAKAAALQGETGDIKLEAVKSGQKLTQNEVERIASEAGLTPAFINQAILEFEGIPKEDSFFIDTFDKNQIELAGFASGTYDEATAAGILEIIRSHYKTEGSADLKNDGFLWTDKKKEGSVLTSPGRIVQVSTTGTGDRLHIRIREKVRLQRLPDIPAWMCLAVIVLLIRNMIIESHFTPLFAIIIAGAFSLLFFNMTDKLKNKKRVKMSTLMKDLQLYFVRKGR